MSISMSLGPWVLVIFMLIYSSILIKDNLFFRIVIATNLAAAVAIDIKTNITSLQGFASIMVGGRWLYLIGMIFGLSTLLILTTKYRWVSRYGTTMLIGAGYGATMGPLIVVTVLSQVRSTTTILVTTDPIKLFGGIVALISMITSLFYFTFTIPRKGPLELVRKIGHYFVLFMLGAITATLPADLLQSLTTNIQRVLWDLLGLIPKI